VARLEDCILRGPPGSKGRHLADSLPLRLLAETYGLQFVRENASNTGGVAPDVLRRLGCKTFGLKEVLGCLGKGWAKGMWRGAFVSDTFASPSREDVVRDCTADKHDQCRVVFYNCLCDFLHHELQQASKPKSTIMENHMSLSEILAGIREVQLLPILKFDEKGEVQHTCSLSEKVLFRSFSSELPEEWQAPLADAGIIHVLDPDLLRFCGEQYIMPFLDALHISAPSLVDIAGQILEQHAMPMDGIAFPTNTHASAAGLACLRELWIRDLHHADGNNPACIVLQHFWPRISQVLRIPDETGNLIRPRHLECRTLFGIYCPLPPDVCQQIQILCGSTLPGELHSRVHPEMISSTYINHGQSECVARLESEAFLQWLGVHAMSVGCWESNILLLQLGKCFGSSDFWSGLLSSPTAALHVKQQLTGILDPLGHSVSKQIPEYFASHIPNMEVCEGVALKDLFLKRHFVRYGGRFLSYIDLDLANASDSTKSDVLTAMKSTGISVDVSFVTLTKVWRQLSRPRTANHPTKQCQACEVYADLFSNLLDRWSVEVNPKEWEACKLPFSDLNVDKPIYVQDIGYLSFDECVWEQHNEISLVRLAGLTALSPTYGRFGDSQRSFFVTVAKIAERLHAKHYLRALRSLLDQVDAATSAVAIGASHGQAADITAPPGGWAFEKPSELPSQAIQRVRDICKELAGIIHEEKVKRTASGDAVAPLPTDMVKQLYQWLRPGGPGSDLASVKQWFMDNFNGVPMHLQQKLSQCAEFAIVEEGSSCRLYRASAHTCRSELVDIRSSFQEEHLIIVPGRHRQLPGGFPVQTFKKLHSGEAYWNVAPALQQCQCQAWALSQHYPSELEAFFLDVGVQRELTVEDLSRRLKMCSQAESDNHVDAIDGTDAPVHWHSEGYQVGDFIDGEGDVNLLQAMEDPWREESAPGALARNLLEQRDAVRNNVGAVISDTLEAMRHAHESQLDLQDSLDLSAEDRASGGHRSAQLIERNVNPALQKLVRIGDIGMFGMTLWAETRTLDFAPEALDAAAMNHIRMCAQALHQAAAFYGLPSSSINLVSTTTRSACPGAFSAKFRHSIFIVIPEERQDAHAPSIQWADCY
jgi:hypothetical protein